jgi:hypothetical protein
MAAPSPELPPPRRAVAHSFAPPIATRSIDRADGVHSSRYEMSPAVQSTRRVRSNRGEREVAVQFNGGVFPRSAEHHGPPATETTSQR